MIFKSFKTVLVTVLAIVSVCSASRLSTRQAPEAICCHSCDDDPACQVTLNGKYSHYKVSVNTLVGVECGDQGLPKVVDCSVTLDPLGHN